jgi:prepilin-type N-terminal cleavage/methylation domain-containing protein
MARGFTLLEMTVAVSLAAVLLAVGIPAAHRSMDRMAVVGAREALVGMVVRARSEALARGGATLVVDPFGGRIQVESGTDVLESLDLDTAFGVGLDVGTPSRVVRLSFDGLGIGRVASRTIVLQRGVAQAGVVVSSYGRVTRR